MPTMVREQRKIEHRFTPVLVALREVLEDIFLEFANMTVGVKHSPFAHESPLEIEVVSFVISPGWDVK
jgi:hypothetical protein